jgi:hypothetical protein
MEAPREIVASGAAGTRLVLRDDDLEIEVPVGIMVRGEELGLARRRERGVS